MSTHKRRTFLKLAATGAVTAAATWAGLDARAKAGGGPGGVPPRFLFIPFVAGSTVRATFMRPSFSLPEWGHWSDILRIRASVIDNTTPDPTEFDFNFADVAESEMSEVLHPFWNLRSKMTFLEGLAMLSTGWDPHGDAHAKNHLAVATGGPASDEYDGVRSHAAYPSIDQRIGEFLRSQGDPAARVLNFAANPSRRSGTDGYHYYFYSTNPAGGTSRVSLQADPLAAADSLFGSVGGTDDETRARARAYMFAQLQDEYGGLVSRTSGADRARLETHRELIGRIASRVVPASCSRPVVPPRSTGDRTAQVTQDFQTFGDIIGASFACGLSRVATLSLGVDTPPPEAYGIDPSADIHHDYEHMTPAESFYPGPGPVAEERAMIDRNVWQTQRVARVLETLDSIPDVDGNTVLDNTIVLYASESGDGSHSSEFTPFTLFGGGATGAVRPGRYLKYQQATPNPWRRNYQNEYTGTAHSHLYVSILQAMGLPDNHIHAASIPGEVPHRSISTTVDMSGPLPRLT